MSTTTFALALDVNNAIDNGILDEKKCDSSVKIKTPATRKKIPYRIEFHNDNDEDEIFELDAADNLIELIDGDVMSKTNTKESGLERHRKIITDLQLKSCVLPRDEVLDMDDEKWKDWINKNVYKK
eukprot:g8546.t1